MAIKTAESGVLARVGRVSRNTGIFFRPYMSGVSQVSVPTTVSGL